jgi:hypothetical protein
VQIKIQRSKAGEDQTINHKGLQGCGDWLLLHCNRDEHYWLFMLSKLFGRQKVSSQCYEHLIVLLAWGGGDA